MNNKPFDPNKPYRRRDGKPAKIVYATKKGIQVVESTDKHGDEMIYSVDSYGKTFGLLHIFDLINIPEKIEGWLNVYGETDDKKMRICGDIFYFRDDADLGRSANRIACINVFFTEGEGLTDDNNQP